MAGGGQRFHRSLFGVEIIGGQALQGRLKIGGGRAGRCFCLNFGNSGFIGERSGSAEAECQRQHEAAEGLFEERGRLHKASLF